MSEQSDKRFEPTPARKEKAKREGNVARSAELTGIASFAAALLATRACVPVLASAAIVAVTVQRRTAIATLLCVACVPACAAAAAGTGAALAQAGGLRVTALKLDLARLHPGKGLQRMVGAEAAVGAARAGVALLVALAAMVPLGAGLLAAAASLSSPLAAASLAGGAALRAGLLACAAGGVFAFADYALVRRRWLRGLRMSLDELKRETKEQDGDPQTRARRRSLHRALLRGAVERTRDASFVVVNPTHIAIALRYAPPQVPVPEILVRAADASALRVKAIACERGIPVIENVPLARLLYAAGEDGRAIPPETFVAVAQIVAALAREGVPL